MKKTFIIVLFMISLIVPTIEIVKSVKFQQDCSGYLKQAADASTPELALERINLAIAYIEDHNLTDGYTSAIYKTEDENIGFWYRNIISCKEELEACLDASPLERTNVLMKVREALVDDGDNGTTLTIPDGISRYPNNFTWGVLLTLSIFGIVICFIVFLIDLLDYGWSINKS